MLNKESGFVNILVGLVVVVGIVIAAVSIGGNEEIVEAPNTEVAEETIENEEKMMDDEEASDMSEEEMMDADEVSSSGFLKEYSSMDMLAQGPENKVLFFHASWCPSCRALESSLNNEEIPADLGIYKVDYDNSTELKKKYGVTSQHTLVQVDAEGEMITKWLGGNDVESIVRKLN